MVSGNEKYRTLVALFFRVTKRFFYGKFLQHIYKSVIKYIRVIINYWNRSFGVKSENTMSNIKPVFLGERNVCFPTIRIWVFRYFKISFAASKKFFDSFLLWRVVTKIRRRFLSDSESRIIKTKNNSNVNRGVEKRFVSWRTIENV